MIFNLCMKIHLFLPLWSTFKMLKILKRFEAEDSKDVWFIITFFWKKILLKSICLTNFNFSYSKECSSSVQNPMNFQLHLWSFQFFVATDDYDLIKSLFTRRYGGFTRLKFKEMYQYRPPPVLIQLILLHKFWLKTSTTMK